MLTFQNVRRPLPRLCLRLVSMRVCVSVCRYMCVSHIQCFAPFAPPGNLLNAMVYKDKVWHPSRAHTHTHTHTLIHTHTHTYARAHTHTHTHIHTHTHTRTPFAFVGNMLVGLRREYFAPSKCATHSERARLCALVCARAVYGGLQGLWVRGL